MKYPSLKEVSLVTLHTVLVGAFAVIVKFRVIFGNLHFNL